MTIRLVVLDIDGVLTDGRLRLSEDSSEGKTLSYRDLDAITEAQSRGLSLALLTGEDDALCEAIAGRLRISKLAKGYKDKVAGIRVLAKECQVAPTEMAFVGDSDRDAKAFPEVGLSFAPQDGSDLARQLATFTLHAKGGAGAVAEALTIVFKLSRIL